MSWQNVNESLTERIHLAKRWLSGTQNSNEAGFAPASCSPSQAVISLPSQDPLPSLPPGQEADPRAKACRKRQTRPKFLQTNRLASDKDPSWQDSIINILA